jgi:hypothetical protein
MKTGPRVLLGIFTALIINFYGLLFLFPHLGIVKNVGVIKNLLFISISIFCVFVIWRLTANLSEDQSNQIKKGGIIGGLTGFLIGFVGPIIFQPNANLGPLLGIFFTIPIGTVLGLIGGFLKSRKRTHDLKC